MFPEHSEAQPARGRGEDRGPAGVHTVNYVDRGDQPFGLSFGCLYVA